MIVISLQVFTLFIDQHCLAVLTKASLLVKDPRLNSVIIRNSSVAFVSKDISLRVEDAVVSDSILCVAAYRKKQEFSGLKL